MTHQLCTVLILCLLAPAAFAQSPPLQVIEGGNFQRGCTAGQQPCSAAALPSHSVSLSGYAIGTYEVSQSEYLAVMGNNPSSNVGCSACPVERVSWYSAVVYCNTLSQQEGLEPVYFSDPELLSPFFSTAGEVYWDTEANGYRLPTEAEWEYAARGGALGADLRFAGSDNWTEVAVSGSATQPAGTKLPNELGLFDISGNVAEWVWDTEGDYPDFPLCDPRGLGSGSGRIVRGGHFLQMTGVSVSSRAEFSPGSQSSTLGFRVARTVAADPLVMVPGGTFTMGCTNEQEPECQNDEYPPHTVTVDDFFISRFEVTQAEWAALVPEYTPLYNRGAGPEHPTYRVSWYDAATYCNRLSLAEGRTPVYYFDEGFTAVFDSLVGDQLAYVDIYWDNDADGYRLPTEAEWEYAARGGALAQGALYSGGNNLDAFAWHGGNSGTTCQPIGLLAPNELGLYDMTGNIYEWCWDWYDSDYYQTSGGDNPTGPASSTLRTIRGGSWNTTPSGSRVANRLNFLPGARRTTFAFRIARSK